MHKLLSEFEDISVDSISSSFGYLFPELVSDPQNRLETSDKTKEDLGKLGGAMAANGSNETGAVPAAYTYLGQFLDHDITLTNHANEPDLNAEDLSVINPGSIGAELTNKRSGALDLDSVYSGRAKRDGEKMALSEVTPVGFGPIQTPDPFHDLPRSPASEEDPANDRRALIGDDRNDENLIVAQLHTAFLRAHNKMVDDGASFDEAKSKLTRMYQHVILEDFLPRICDREVLDKLKESGPIEQLTVDGKVRIPIEFSTAAYRFGHSMVRQDYHHNKTFDPADFKFFFTFTALSGELSTGGRGARQHPTLPNNWIIEWSRFLPGDGLQNPARKIDTLLAPELASLTNVNGEVDEGVMKFLATRNLLRGYHHALPTGQALAQALGFAPMTPDQIKMSTPSAVAQVLSETGFDERTPLWFYVLAEAKFQDNGEKLGELGSTLVAHTIHALVKATPNNIIDNPIDDPSIDLAKLISLGTPLSHS